MLWRKYETDALSELIVESIVEIGYFIQAIISQLACVFNSVYS